MDMNKKETPQAAQTPKNLLTVEQAAEILHYSRSYLYKKE